MKLFAAKGKVELQAHSGGIELTAHKGVKVISITEAIEVAGKREILLTSGGAYIRIKDGNIEVHAPGTIDVKGAKRVFAGPVSSNYFTHGVAGQGDMKPGRSIDFSG
jgi:type VI secretion system secreted protein VgrG